MKLIIEDDEGQRTVIPFVHDELTIGRHEANLVRLTERNVSRKHGRLLREAGRFFIEDLDSLTGIRVNGEKIAGKRLLREGDLIQISEYDLSLQAGPEEKAAPPEPPAITPGAAEEIRELAPAGRPLVGMAGSGRGKELVPDRTPIHLGRSGENDVEIDHPVVLPTESSAKARALAAAQPGGGSRKSLVLGVGAALALGAVAFFAARHRQARGFGAENGSEEAVQDSKGERRLAPRAAKDGASAQKSDAATSGYAAQHLAAARLMKDKDRAGCLAEAKLALQANPRSAEARSLVETCKLPPQAAAVPGVHGNSPAARPASPAPGAVFATARTDGEARKLLSDGNEKLVGEDFPSAIAAYQQALAMKPGDSVLSGLYRSMGIAFTRQGNLEQGARYYRLYLPLCADPNERAQLQKLLGDYEARRR